MQAVALLLQNEIDDHGGSSVQCSAGAGFVIVARVCSHEGHIGMHMRIYAAGEYQLAGSIDCLSAFTCRSFPDSGNGFHLRCEISAV